MIKDLNELKMSYVQLIARFEKELDLSPEGSLNCKVEKNRTYFYHYIDADGSGIKKQKYIPNKNTQLLHHLNRKRFLQSSIKVLKNNICAIDKFVSTYNPYNPTEIASTLPIELEHLNSYCSNNDLNHWANEKYEKSRLYPERLIHSTIMGLKVRSKSEAIIAGILENNNIPFRYEAALRLDDKTYYPDFTILTPRNKKLIYWEHFGKVDFDDYATAMDNKMANYRKNNITPWNNLITTYETESSPISSLNIHNIIKTFLL